MDTQWYNEQFERERPRLKAIAYRMLGSIADAEDAVQEAWLRMNQTDSASINNINGWLTTVVGRVSIDMLRARRARREDMPGTWLPEPVISDADDLDPEQQTLLADSIGVALLVVLESLHPAERLAFVLHDMFAVPYEEIAPIVEKSPAATRQLASRARRRVQGSSAVPDADLPTQRRVVNAFLAAARAGDFEALIEVLDPNVVFRVDTGPRTWLAPPLLSGAHDVATHAASQGPRFATLCEPAIVNGAAGIVARSRSRVVAVVGMTVVGGHITEIDLILDTDKLAAARVGN
jgi:RNA polymerase sigma-70 factor (ECF subfamily)